jgi:predicted DNA-binding protein (MmcQ/YjbR family)
LRIVVGVYKATLIQSLEVETYTPPLDLYLDNWLAKFRERLAQSEIGKLIQEAYSAIRDRLKKRKRGSRSQT